MKVGVGLNTLLRRKTESPETDEKSCPSGPVARAYPAGRLANQLSIYVNHIALEREYGKQRWQSKDQELLKIMIPPPLPAEIN